MAAGWRVRAASIGRLASSVGRIFQSARTVWKTVLRPQFQSARTVWKTVLRHQFQSARTVWKTVLRHQRSAASRLARSHNRRYDIYRRVDLNYGRRNGAKKPEMTGICGSPD